VSYSEWQLYKEWGAGTRTMEYARARKQEICNGPGGRGNRKKGLNYLQKEEPLSQFSL